MEAVAKALRGLCDGTARFEVLRLRRRPRAAVPRADQISLPGRGEEVNQRRYDGYYSSNLTCEMGMTQATGKPYQSILYLVEEATRS